MMSEGNMKKEDKLIFREMHHSIIFTILGMSAAIASFIFNDIVDNAIFGNLFFVAFLICFAVAWHSKKKFNELTMY